MKRIFLLAGLWLPLLLTAQMDLPPVAGNPRAKISEEVGITSITISYSRPDVGGREGKVWGNVVTEGFSTPNFLSGRANSPWRAGANENTLVTFEHDVYVEAIPLPAGTYGFHVAYFVDSCVLIFSRTVDAWGSFYYEEKNDALRVTVKPVKMEKSAEWLKYEFIEHRDDGCTIALMWEKLSIPFRVSVDLNRTVMNRLREEVKSQKGFNSNNLVQAAQFATAKGFLEEGLAWSIRAITGFNGQKSYFTLRNLATVYEKMNSVQQADSVMSEALNMANANQFTAYARSLITQQRSAKALEVMLAGKNKWGDGYAIQSGLIYAYAANRDTNKALDAANKALAQATSDQQKKTISDLIDKLKAGKEIN